MTTNVICCREGSYQNLEKNLQDWLDLYVETLQPNAKLDVFLQNDGSFVIVVDPTIDDEQFIYLVNYLYYPFSSLKNGEIFGFVVPTSKEWFPDELLGKEVMVFVDDDDEEHDNVSVVAANSPVYKIDFSGKITKQDRRKNYEPPVINNLTDGKVLSVKQSPKRNEESQHTATGRRFMIISAVAIGLVMLSFFGFLHGRETFFSCILWINIGVSAWLLGDYKLLQRNEYYLYSFLLSILIIVVALFIQRHFPENDLSLSELGGLSPIGILIVQRPLRYVFMQIFKREPIVDKPPPSFADFVYAAILLCSIILGFLVGLWPPAGRYPRLAARIYLSPTVISLSTTPPRVETNFTFIFTGPD